MTSDEFRRLCRLWPTGVAVVTTTDALGRYYGLTMNSVTSVSLDPPMLLICPASGSQTLRAMRKSRIFCVNFLAGTQEGLARRFARREQDKFDGVPFRSGRLGAPVLEGVLASFECCIDGVFPGGDHEIVLGLLTHAEGGADGTPLVFYKGQYCGAPLC